MHEGMMALPARCTGAISKTSSPNLSAVHLQASLTLLHLIFKD